MKKLIIVAVFAPLVPVQASPTTKAAGSGVRATSLPIAAFSALRNGRHTPLMTMPSHLEISAHTAVPMPSPDAAPTAKNLPRETAGRGRVVPAHDTSHDAISAVSLIEQGVSLAEQDADPGAVRNILDESFAGTAQRTSSAEPPAGTSDPSFQGKPSASLAASAKHPGKAGGTGLLERAEVPAPSGDDKSPAKSNVAWSLELVFAVGLIALGSWPLGLGLIGMFGTPMSLAIVKSAGTLTALGAAFAGSGSLLMLHAHSLPLASRPRGDAFGVYLAVVAGMFGSMALTSKIISGVVGQTWIFAALLGGAILFLMAMPSLEEMRRTEGGRQGWATLTALAGAVGSIVAMFLLQGPMGGAGILLGLAGLMAMGTLSLFMPRIVAAVSKTWAGANTSPIAGKIANTLPRRQASKLLETAARNPSRTIAYALAGGILTSAIGLLLWPAGGLLWAFLPMGALLAGYLASRP